MMAEPPTLAELSGAELDVLADEFVILCNIPDYPRLAGWGRRQGYLVMAELARRCGIDPGPTPEIVTLDDVPTSQLHALRGLFEQLADVESIEGTERPFARWLLAMRDQIGASIERRDRLVTDPSPLKDWIRERRRDRPHGTPGDVTDIPSWREVSGDT